MADMNLSPMPQPEGRRGVITPGVLIGGALAGIIGGILMGLALTGWGLTTVLGGSTPWQSIAATYFGPMAYLGAAGVTCIGVLTFLTIAALFGIFFAMITLKIRSAKALFWLGIPYGVAVWAFMTYAIMPVFDQTMAVRIPMIAVFWFFSHWIFGAFTGVFTPSLRRAFGVWKISQRDAGLRRAA